MRYQLDNTESGLGDYTGLSFMELYRLCRFSTATYWTLGALRFSHACMHACYRI